MSKCSIGRCLAKLLPSPQDFVFRAIVLATLIIVAALFAAIEGSNGSQSKTEKQAAPGTYQEEQSESFWQRTTTDPIAAYTGVLALFTAALVGVAIFQIYFLSESNETARIAADAARDSAEALQAAERANVIERLEGTYNLDALFRSGERYPNSPSMDESEYPVLPIGTTLSFKNYGKTPAVVLSYRAEPEIAKNAPEFDITALVEHRFKMKRLVDPIIEAGGITEEIPIARAFDHSWSQSNSVVRGPLSVWFVGHVTFSDVFDVVRTRQFVWLYDRPMRQFVPYSSKSWIEKKP